MVKTKNTITVRINEKQSVRTKNFSIGIFRIKKDMYEQNMFFSSLIL